MQTLYFLLVVNPTTTICAWVGSKPTHARLFASGNGMEFYCRQPTAKIVDKLANVVMNKALELTGTTRGITLVRVTRNPKKPSEKQLKLL